MPMAIDQATGSFRGSAVPLSVELGLQPGTLIEGLDRGPGTGGSETTSSNNIQLRRYPLAGNGAVSTVIIESPSDQHFPTYTCTSSKVCRKTESGGFGFIISGFSWVARARDVLLEAFPKWPPAQCQNYPLRESTRSITRTHAFNQVQIAQLFIYATPQSPILEPRLAVSTPH